MDDPCYQGKIYLPVFSSGEDRVGMDVEEIGHTTEGILPPEVAF